MDHVSSKETPQPETCSRESRRGQRREFFRDHDCCGHGSGGTVWGLLLIAAGITLFLNYSGMLPWGFWDHIWQFWPLILVLAGFRILIGDTPGTEVVMTLVTILVFSSVFIKILIDINSPLIYTWHLNNVPWYNYLQQSHLPT